MSGGFEQTDALAAGAQRPLRARAILRAGWMQAVPRRTLVALGAYLLGYLLWQSFRWGGHADQALIGDAALVPPTVLAVLLAWRAGDRTAPLPRLRSAWRIFALAILLAAVGHAIEVLYAATGSHRFPSIADVFFLISYWVAFVAVLRFPHRPAITGRAHLRRALDAATIAVGGAAVVWYVMLGPTVFSGGGNVLSGIVSTAYPADDIILIVALTRLLTDTPPEFTRAPLRLLMLGLLFYVVGDVLTGWLLIHSTYTDGDPVDIASMLAIALFALAASSQRPVDARQAASPWQSGAEPRPSIALTLAAAPYLAVAAVFGMLIAALSGEPFFPALSLALTAAIVAALLTARQLLARRELVAVHSELKAAHDELAALATTDPLTGLPNHRALVSVIDQELERSTRFQRTCALLFVDIDYFKELNDGWGHVAGDAALNELGRTVRGALRTMDTLGRWGGEEFVVVLPEVSPADAMLTAERIRAAVAARPFAATGGTHLTVSIGAATFPADGTARSELLAAADRAMYAAKRLGRNQAFSSADPVVSAFGDSMEVSASTPDERAMMGAVDALAMLVEARDSGTAEHTRQVAKLAQRVAIALGCTPRQARDVFLAAKLHDIGKVAIADAILRKPGRLTPEEWAMMRLHPAIGADVVSRVGQLAELAPIIRSHHERYDGTGYPEGLKGEQIPLQARIIGVADALDAMITDRPYRPRMTIDEAREELRRRAGSQFDPDVVAATDRLLAQEAAAEHAAAAQPRAGALSARRSQALPQPAVHGRDRDPAR